MNFRYMNFLYLLDNKKIVDIRWKIVVYKMIGRYVDIYLVIF